MPIARLLAGAAPVSSDDDLSSPRGIGDFAALVSHSVEEIGSSSSTGTNPRQDTLQKMQKRGSVEAHIPAIPADNCHIAINVIQYPERHRLYGLSMVDRRPIEPPPILKLDGVELSRGPAYILFSTLWSLFVFSLGASFSGD